MPRSSELDLPKIFRPQVWRFWCVGVFFPATAVLHHAVFFRPTCMMNPFGEDYTARAVRVWITTDLSLPLGVLTALIAYWLGRSSLKTRVLLSAAVLAALPLTLNIWDLPFLGRPICRTLHDERIHLFFGPLKTRHFYMLSAILYPLVLMLPTWRRWVRN